MIEKLFNHPRIVHQTADRTVDEYCEPNAVIAVHVDNGGTLILSQEGRDVVIDWPTVPELIKAIKQVQQEMDARP